MKKKTVYILLAAAILIAAGIFLCFRLCRYSPELDVNAVTSPTVHVAVSRDSSGIYIADCSVIHIPAGETEVALNLMNPKGNSCYFTFCISLADTDEVIYTSKAVESGSYIGTAELKRPLDAGYYDARVTITASSAKDGSPMGEINQDIRLIVK